MPAVDAGTLVVALVVALAPDARAEEALGVLAVAPPPGPGPALVEMTVQLRDRVAEYHPGVLTGAQLRERMVGPGGASPAELDRAYEGARAAYVAGDYEESVRTLRAIVEDLEKLPDGEETFARWRRAMLRLARSEQALGRDDAARAHVERLVRAAPDLEVDRSESPARVVSEVERARAALAAGGARQVAVRSSAAGARVFLDGRDVGAAPLTLSVPRGRHRISGAHGPLRTGRVVVDVAEEAQDVFLDFSVPEAVRPFAGPGIALPDEDRAARVVAAGAHLRLDRVLAVGLAEDDAGASHLVGSLHDVRRGMVVREGRVRLANGSVPVGGTAALAEFLVTGHAPSGIVEAPGEPRATGAAGLRARPHEPPAAVSPGPTRAPAQPARRSRALGWLAFGSGIAAVGLAAFGAVELRDADDRYDKARQLRASDALGTIENVDRYNAYVTEGDASTRRATLTFAAAGASAVAAGILGYVNYRRTGEFGPFRF